MHSCSHLCVNIEELPQGTCNTNYISIYTRKDQPMYYMYAFDVLQIKYFKVFKMRFQWQLYLSLYLRNFSKTR